MSEQAPEVPDPNSPEEMTVDEWKAEFDLLMKNPPTEDCLLYTADQKPVRIEIDCQLGKAPFIYGRAYVPKIVGSRLGWFAQSIADDSDYGLKVILLPKSRDEVIKRHGLSNRFVEVKVLRVIRQSQSGSSLLGEIAQW